MQCPIGCLFGRPTLAPLPEKEGLVIWLLEGVGWPAHGIWKLPFWQNEQRCWTCLHRLPERRIEKNMDITLPLEKMTIAEKLRVMETLWSDLTRNEEQFESPDWHGEVLRERAARVKQGKESFVDWETAKKQLRNRVK